MIEDPAQRQQLRVDLQINWIRMRHERCQFRDGEAAHQRRSLHGDDPGAIGDGSGADDGAGKPAAQRELRQSIDHQQHQCEQHAVHDAGGLG